MKTTKRFSLAYAAPVFALLALPFAAYALVSYSPGALLQPGDVATTTIRNYAVGPSQLASGLDYTIHGLTLTNATSTFATTTVLAITGSTLSLNNVVYTTPSADGTAGQSLTTNGSKTLSWANAAPTNTYSVLPATIAVTKGDAVRVGGDSIFFIASSTVYAAGGGTTFTVSVNVTSVPAYVLAQTFIGNTTAITSLTANGVAMTPINGKCQNTCAQSLLQEGFLATTTGQMNVTLTIPSTAAQVALSMEAYGGVASSGTIDATSTATSASATTLTCTTNNVSTNDWSVMHAMSTAGGIAAGTNSTQIVAPLAPYEIIYDSSGVEPTTASGNFSMTYTGTSGEQGCLMVSLKPTGTMGVRDASSRSTGQSNPFIGFAENTAAMGANVTVDTSGMSTVFSGLTSGALYYLSDVLGAISTSPGTVSHRVLVAASSTAGIVTNAF